MTLIERAKALILGAFPRSAIARSVGVLVGGTALGQVLLVLVSPVLTRLYTAEDFGALAIYMALLSLFGVVSSLRYELAIPLPEHDEDAANLAALCFVLVGVVVAISIVTVYFAGHNIASLLGSPALERHLWLLPAGIFLAGIDASLRHLAIREKAFRIVAKTTVKRALANIMIQLCGFKFGSLSLIVGHACAQGAGVWSLSRLFFDGRKSSVVSISGIFSQAIRFKRFPLYSVWEGLLNTAGAQLPPLIFAALFSPAAAGLYSLANRVLALPISMVSGAVAQVFLSEAPRAHREGRLGLLIVVLHGKLATIGLPPAMLLFVVAPELFGLVFGPDWTEAGIFARWMTPWLYLVFITSPFSTIPSVLGRQQQGMIFQLVLLLSRVFAIIVGANIGGLFMTIILYSVTSAVCWCGFLVWVKIATDITLRDIVSPTFSAAFIALICISPSILEKILPAATQSTWWIGFILSSMFLCFRMIFVLRRQNERRQIK